MLYLKKMYAISISLLFFVILSDYTFGKISSRLLKRVGSEALSSADNELSGGESNVSGEDSDRIEDSRQPAKDFKGSADEWKSSRSSSSGEINLPIGAKGEEIKLPLSPWQKGTVPYRIDKKCYDDIIVRRIREAMKSIESASCVLFKNMTHGAKREGLGVWLHITNPENERDCVHETRIGDRGEAVTVLGFECMQKQDIIHALLHALGFKDEVTHPQRDSYVRVLWENIQPKYHSLFAIQNEPPPYQTLVEYDTMSVMHFHDRAFSSNGGATVTPLISGLLINPSEGLSQIDIMKLRLAFGQECNKRKVDDLLNTCKTSLIDGGSASDSEEGDSRGSGSKESDSKEADSKERDNKERESNESGNDDDRKEGKVNGGKNNGSGKDAEGSEIVESLIESDKEGSDSGSDENAIVDVTDKNTISKRPVKAPKEKGKKGLGGSRWGFPGGQKRRGRRHMKKKSSRRTKKQVKSKRKQKKTRQRSKQNRTKRHNVRAGE